MAILSVVCLVNAFYCGTYAAYCFRRKAIMPAVAGIMLGLLPLGTAAVCFIARAFWT